MSTNTTTTTADRVRSILEQQAAEAVMRLDWLVWLGEATDDEIADLIRDDHTVRDAWATKDARGRVIL